MKHTYAMPHQCASPTGYIILLHVTPPPLHIVTFVTRILPLLIIYSELRLVVSLYMPQTELNAKRSWQSMPSKTCSYCNPVWISEDKTKALFTLRTNQFCFPHPIFRTQFDNSYIFAFMHILSPKPLTCSLTHYSLHSEYNEAPK